MKCSKEGDRIHCETSTLHDSKSMYATLIYYDEEYQSNSAFVQKNQIVRRGKYAYI
jgi:hypothetical protein